MSTTIQAVLLQKFYYKYVSEAPIRDRLFIYESHETYLTYEQVAISQRSVEVAQVSMKVF